MTVSVALLVSPYAEALESNLASRSVDVINDSATKCNIPFHAIIIFLCIFGGREEDAGLSYFGD